MPSRAFVIVYAGRIAREKNMVFLAKSVVSLFKENEDIRFLMEGPGKAGKELLPILKEEEAQREVTR